MIANYGTAAIKVGDVKVDAGVSNTVIRNGFLGSIPFNFLNSKMRMQLFVINTQYTGDEVYADKYNEIGFAIGPKPDTRKEVTDGFVQVA